MGKRTVSNLGRNAAGQMQALGFSLGVDSSPGQGGWQGGIRSLGWLGPAGANVPRQFSYSITHGEAIPGQPFGR